MQELLGTFLVCVPDNCRMWQVASLSPKIFAPLLVGFFLDHLQIYGREIGVGHLGYFVVYGISALFFLIGGSLVWFIKSVK